jgi:REP element-mobilizing transposase RayT
MPSTIKPRRVQKGWHYRGYLPHFDADTVIQLITFRLADSLPKAIFSELAAQASNHADLRQRVEAMTDGGLGSCALQDPDVATVVRDALHHFDGDRYRLIAWIIMPNHVHALIEQADGFPLGDVVHAWKSFTAKQANKHLGRTGAFWAPDYFDRYIRDQIHFDAAVHYIHENPVKAGLVARAEEWRWSSAWQGAGTAGVPPAY